MGVADASRNEPGPPSARVVTWYTVPLRPPVASAPKPNAPGNAGLCAQAAGAAARVTQNNALILQDNSPKFTVSNVVYFGYGTVMR